MISVAAGLGIPFWSIEGESIVEYAILIHLGHGVRGNSITARTDRCLFITKVD